MLFLPEYYGIDFGGQLPIFSVSRMMFILFYIYTILNRRRSPMTILQDFLPFLKRNSLLLVYFALRIMSNMFYISTYNQAKKTILFILLEQLALILAFYMLSPTKDEMQILLKTVVFSGTILFALGIIESIFFVRPFDHLYTVSRYMHNDHYIRLGLLRATTTMGLPVFYGNMCLLLFPFILYLYENTRHKKYLISLALCTMATLHSGSRSGLVFLPILLIFYFTFIIKRKRRLLFIKNLSVIVSLCTIVIVFLCLSSPKLAYFYSGSAKSILNEVGFNIDLNTDAPEGVNGYGSNSNNGSNSRLEQFSGIYYTILRHPLIGFGSGAQDRGDFLYYSFKLSKWYKLFSYDVGIVEVVCSEGLLGLCGYICLFIYLFKNTKYGYSSSFGRFIIITYLICMLCTANMYTFLMFITCHTIFYRKSQSV